MVDESVSEATSWREQAVARSLDPARARAEERVQRFLDAALELMSASPDKEFTVQEVVEKAGQSLRSFYQYFAGKHELLLALFEEGVSDTAEQVGATLDGIDDPLERLHRFTNEYYLFCRPETAAKKTKASSVWLMADFAQQLLTKHPHEAARAFAPLVARFEALLDDAAAAGAIRDDLDHQRITGVVLQAVMFNTFAETISASSRRQPKRSAEGLWELLLDGLGTGPRS